MVQETIFVAILLQINCYDYSSVERVWLFNLIFYVSNISDQSYADASSPNITRLPQLMPGVCLLVGEEEKKER